MKSASVTSLLSIYMLNRIYCKLSNHQKIGKKWKRKSFSCPFSRSVKELVGFQLRPSEYSKNSCWDLWYISSGWPAVPGRVSVRGRAGPHCAAAAPAPALDRRAQEGLRRLPERRGSNQIFKAHFHCVLVLTLVTMARPMKFFFITFCPFVQTVTIHKF